MTSKEAYLEIAAKRKAEKVEKGEVLELPMPSGAVWKYLPVDLQQYFILGDVPKHLIAKLSSVRGLSEEAAFNRLNPEEAEKMILLGMTITRDVILNNLVEPRVTLIETDDSITPDMILPEDFTFFKNFIMRGAQADANPKSKPASSKRKRAA